MEDLSNYDRLRNDALKLFGTFRQVLCPAVNEYVHFTSEGFNHIVFKGDRREREKNSQIMRFKLLPRAYRLIEVTTTFQEYEETIKQFIIKSHKQKIPRTKTVRYWGIIAIFEGRKIKVILRKVGDGQVHFWSIVPAWTANKYRDSKFITTMKGDPAED